MRIVCVNPELRLACLSVCLLDSSSMHLDLSSSRRLNSILQWPMHTVNILLIIIRKSQRCFRWRFMMRLC